MNFFDQQFSRIHLAANNVAARSAWDVLFVSHHPYFFDQDEFRAYRSERIRSVRFASSHDEIGALDGHFDIAIVCSHVVHEHVTLFKIRQQDLCDFIFVWPFDHHHSEHRTLAANPFADIIIPAHRFAAGYMRSPSTVLGRHVPLSTHQWSRFRARELFQRFLPFPRKDALQGGFHAHGGVGESREALVRELQAALPDHALTLIRREDPTRYFALTAEDRWRGWAEYKVGLILPYYFDLPIRFFDSLLTGQVPIVPTWCRDFDHVIPPYLQQSLPVVRLQEASVDAVRAAWCEALARYDADGDEGARRRHLFALEHHHLANRLEEICTQVLPVAAGEGLRLDVDATSAGFVLNPERADR